MEKYCALDSGYADQDVCVGRNTHVISLKLLFSLGKENAWIVEEKVDVFSSGDHDRAFQALFDL
jgi:hypothetical protein